MRQILTTLGLCLPLLLAAQKRSQADRMLFKANWYKSQKDTARAYKTLERLLRAEPQNVDAVHTLGAWYFDDRSFLRSAHIFSAAAKQNNTFRNRFALPAGRAYLYAQMPDSALVWLFFADVKNPETAKLRAQAAVAVKMRRAQDTNQVRRLSVRINSPVPEFFPSLSGDGNTLFFTRRVNNVNEDFFCAVPDSCGDWFTARNMGYPPNTPVQESAQTISADGHYLFFMRSDNRSGNGWERGGCDLYMSYRVDRDSPWHPGESFGATINTPAYEGMPSVSADVSELYFVSDRPGGFGGKDIWMSRFEFGFWQLPVNLGPSVNTAGNETAPFIAADGKTLFFSSDGHLGLGRNDIFVSKKIADSVWEAPQNLGIPINSAADELSLFVAPDGHHAFFASDRENSGGNTDIFETTLPAQYAVQPNVRMLCHVLDSFTKDPALLGAVVLRDAAGNELAVYHANKGDGSILMVAPEDAEYAFEVRGFGYAAQTGTIKFTGGCPDYCLKDFALLPSGYVRPTRDSLIGILHFEKNVTQITDSQFAALQPVLQTWMNNPDVVQFFVNAFTDNSGTPLINLEKSGVRANGLRDKMKSIGISDDKITATGFGDVSPIADNETDEGRTMNRRVELVVRILE